MTGFGYNVSGFGSFANRTSPVPVVVAYGIGTNSFGATVNAGDVGIFYNGRMTNIEAMNLPSGFTTAFGPINSATRWSSSNSTYYEGVKGGYKIMSGGETSFSGTSIQNGAWAIIRMPGGPMTSLSQQNVATSTNSTQYLNYGATTNINTLRIVGNGGYVSGFTAFDMSGATVLVTNNASNRAVMGVAYHLGDNSSGTDCRTYGGSFYRAAGVFSLSGS
jgi:hypothetical protein